MGFLLSRNVILITLLALGLLLMLGGELDAGAWVDAFALTYWFGVGWVGRLRRLASRPAAPITAQITAMSSRARCSDGAKGAFSRLDPAWKAWLNREANAASGSNTPRQ